MNRNQGETETPKNNAIGKILQYTSEDGIFLELFAAGQDDLQEPLKIAAKSPAVHFFFCLSEEVTFVFSPHYSKTLGINKSFFLYDPGKDVPISLFGGIDSKLVHIHTTIAHLHELFVSDAPEMAFLSSENAERKYYEERPLPPSIIAPLQQLFNARLSPQAQRLFIKGKLYEILACYFSHDSASDVESCPFLQDEDSVKRLKKAKDILITNYTNPPSIAELAKKVGINDTKLKSGFKEVYGNTVFGFVLDYKLEISRGMLESRKYKINEIAFHIGYSNPSHFISSFKKKYGVTPKQYTKETVG
ncbi:MAG: helix-turn-helix transcriptional regulator [Cryomorphaceae bacterium]|nr:helix-turn-helix transcriptional regulator [Cryomorphaceae bacterium]